MIFYKESGLVTFPSVGPVGCWNDASKAADGLKVLFIKVILVARQHTTSLLVGASSTGKWPDVIGILLSQFWELLHGDGGTGIDKLCEVKKRFFFNTCNMNCLPQFSVKYLLFAVNKFN